MRIDFPGIEGNGFVYLDVVKAICGQRMEDKTMVDLGCFRSPYNSQLNFAYKQFVDIQDRPLDDATQQNNFIQKDVIEYLEELEWKFTVAIASDMIEHLSEEKGNRLIELMKEKAYKQIIFTPLGAYNLTKDDHPDSHRSGWQPENFEGWGIIVFPDFHPMLNIGAFFVFHSENIEQEFERVSNELKIKKESWIKLISYESLSTKP